MDEGEEVSLGLLGCPRSSSFGSVSQSFVFLLNLSLFFCTDGRGGSNLSILMEVFRA